MKFALFLLAIASSLLASEDSPDPSAPLQSECVLDELQGIRFVGNWDLVQKKFEQPIYTVIADRVFLLNSHPSFLQQLQSRYVGRSFTQRDLWNLECDLSAFYRSHGQPFAIICVPKQNLEGNVLQVVVTEARLGQVSFKGNQNSSPDKLRKLIRANPGDPIDGTRLVQDMARMNQNPFRRTDAVWRPGAKPGTADLELDTIDRMPYRFYSGADNTGTVATSRNRLFFGVNLGKTIVEDSEFSYQFTCSPNWNRFIAQTALCRVPFPARQTFIFSGGYAQVQPDLSDGNTEKSKSWQVDGRYRIPIITDSAFLQEILLGYDFKQVIGRIKGKTPFRGIADINQLMVGYDLGHRSPSHRLSLVAELYGNPGWITTHNQTDDYELFRNGAGPYYVYGKLSHSFAYRWNHWWVSYDLNAQLSSKNLLPSEQFTLSGINAVRGFEERVVNTDNAILLNLTLQTPRFSVAKWIGWSRQLMDELYFLAFFDYGLGGNHLLTPDESATQSLASIGPGVRYQIDRYLTAHFDYGFQLFHYGFDNPTNSRYNFGVIVSF